MLLLIDCCLVCKVSYFTSQLYVLYVKPRLQSDYNCEVNVKSPVAPLIEKKFYFKVT